MSARVYHLMQGRASRLGHAGTAQQKDRQLRDTRPRRFRCNQRVDETLYFILSQSKRGTGLGRPWMKFRMCSIVLKQIRWATQSLVLTCLTVLLYLRCYHPQSRKVLVHFLLKMYPYPYRVRMDVFFCRKVKAKVPGLRISRNKGKL